MMLENKKSIPTRIDFTDSVTYAKKGDIHAFEFLYNQSVLIFKSKILPYAHNEQDAEDILQESYIKIFNSLDDLKDPKAFIGWGIKTCVNTASNYVRKHQKTWKREEFHPMASDDEIQGMDAMSASVLREQIDPQEQMDAAETKRLLDEMIADLPDMQRLCILLWQENYSTADISSALDLPAGTVKSNINYAKKKIKEKVLLLEKQGTKLYGLSPLPFFLWIMDLYTREYLPARPAAGSAASFAEIISHASMDATHTFTAANTGVNGNHAAGMSHPSPSAGRPGSLEMPGSLQNASQAMGNTGPASYGPAPMQGGYIGNQAMATGTRIAAGAAGKSVMTKVIIGIVSVAVIGLGGFGTYRLVTGLHDRYVQEQEKTDAQGAGADPSSADGSTRSEAAGDIVSEVSGLEYIGNTHYIGEQEKEIPSGYIVADFADLDSDGEEEIYSFEITQDSKNQCCLSIYEKDGNWTCRDTLQIAVPDTIEALEMYDSHNNSTASSYIYRTTAFLSNDQFLLSYGLKSRYSETLLIYENDELIQKETDLETVPDDARYLVGYDNWFLNTSSNSLFYAQAKEALSPYIHEDERNIYEECYAYNLIDYTNTCTFTGKDFSFSYPQFYDDYLKFEGPTIMHSADIYFAYMLYPLQKLYDERGIDYLFRIVSDTDIDNQKGVIPINSYTLTLAQDTITDNAYLAAGSNQFDLCIAYNMITSSADYLLFSFTSESKASDQPSTLTVYGGNLFN